MTSICYKDDLHDRITKMLPTLHLIFPDETFDETKYILRTCESVFLNKQKIEFQDRAKI